MSTININVLAVTSAMYKDGLITIQLSNGRDLTFRPEQLQGLGGATLEQLNNIEIYPGGRTIRWAALNECVTVEGLIAGVTGSKRWMAAQIAELP